MVVSVRNGRMRLIGVRFSLVLILCIISGIVIRVVMVVRCMLVLVLVLSGRLLILVVRLILVM